MGQKASRIDKAVGRSMELSKALYFGDFVAIPVAILVLAATAISGRGFESIGLWLLAFVVGLFVWTFVEYVVHRWVYHAIPFFEKFHDAHHNDPDALIGVPSFVSSGLILAVLFVICAVFVCSIYANLSFAVTDKENYQYFPPFKRNVNANLNDRPALQVQRWKR